MALISQVKSLDLPTSLGQAKESIIGTIKHLTNVISTQLVPVGGRMTKTGETALAVVFLLIGAHLYYRQKFSFWSRRNVRTPPPLPIFGNFLALLMYPRQQLEVEWPRKYGKVYGFYQGTRPYLSCADVDVLKKICIKDFNKFPNHYFAGVLNKYQKHFLLVQTDDHWRGMRGIMSPTFASGKIKIMFKVLDGCANDLIQVCHDLIEQNQQDTGSLSTPVDLRKLFTSFTMGSALSSFYGVNSGSKSENESVSKREKFAEAARKVFQVSFLRLTLSSVLPHRLLAALNYTLIREGPMNFFADRAKSIIEFRQKQTERKYYDYLQILLDAKATDKENVIELADSDKHEEHHALMEDPVQEQRQQLNGVRPSKMKLTETEVSCQVMMLMMVATETTAVLMSNAAYLLAHHQDVQSRLANELSKIKRRSPDGEVIFDYEDLTSCLYLDCVVSETLRLMPSALYMDRVASEDYYIEKYGVHVPKGTIVMLPYYAIHMDPDYWPEPQKYDPERFTPENKAKIYPGSYCPFGIGPRSCIGFRFALTEAKVGLAKLVSEFQLEAAPGTKYPPEPKKPTFILNDNLNLRVLFRRR